MLIKKPKTYDQQIAILKNKNIAIIDDVSAKTFLKQVNYYRFSGYFLLFQINGHGSLFPNITFERLQAIYEFDEQLRNLIAGVVDEIEVYFRSQLAYYHAHKDDENSEYTQIDEIKAAFEEIGELKATKDGIRGIRRCPECGAAIADDANFCSSCGTKCEKPEPEVYELSLIHI